MTTIGKVGVWVNAQQKPPESLLEQKNHDIVRWFFDCEAAFYFSLHWLSRLYLVMCLDQNWNNPFLDEIKTSATTFYDPCYVILLSKNAAFSLKAADDLCRRVQ